MGSLLTVYKEERERYRRIEELMAELRAHKDAHSRDPYQWAPDFEDYEEDGRPDVFLWIAPRLCGKTTFLQRAALNHLRTPLLWWKTEADTRRIVPGMLVLADQPSLNEWAGLVAACAEIGGINLMGAMTPQWSGERAMPQGTVIITTKMSNTEATNYLYTDGVLTGSTRTAYPTCPLE